MHTTTPGITPRKGAALRPALPLLALLALAAPADAQLYPSSQWGDVNLALPQSQFITESTFNQVPNFEPIVDFTESNRYRQLARSIGRLDLRLVTAFGDEAGISTCTGTLISESHILTNHHCVPGLDPNYQVQEASLLLNYVDAETAEQIAVRYPVSIDPVETSDELDYSILRVDGAPGADPRWGYIPLRVRNPEPREELFIIHHPAGQPQRLTRRNCRLIDSERAVSSELIRHRCDTLGGSSGSLIFSDNNFSGGFEVVALHFAGFREPGPGVFNSAKPLVTIVSQSPFLQNNAQFASGDGTPTRPTTTTPTSTPAASSDPPLSGAPSGTNASGIPQGCTPGGSPEYGPVQVGTRVILGRHRPVDGNDNWADDMSQWAGRETTVRSISGTDASGCAHVRVDVDDGEWAWRVRDLTLPAGGASAGPSSSSIAPGESRSATLTAATSDRYSFSASAGDVVTVSMDAEFDGYLELHDGSGEIVAQDDDGGEGLNPLIENHVIGSSGSYTIVARSFGNSGSGSYTVELSGGGATLAFGQPVQARLPLAQEHDWTFSGSSGETVSIGAQSDDFDTYLELYDPSGSLITQDDDSGEGVNSLIDGWSLNSSGSWTVRVLSYSRESGGDYTIQLSRGSTGGSGGGPGATAGSIVAGGNQDWNYSGQAGEVVTIDAVSDDFDTLLELFGPDGSQLTSDDDGGDGLDSRISSFRLPTSGTYRIRVRSFSDSGAGNYTVTVTTSSGGGGMEASGPSSSGASGTTLFFGAERTGSLAAGGRDVWNFSASAGQPVTIRVTADFDGVLELRGPDGAILTENDDGGEGLNPLISSFSLPVSGEFGIVVRSYNETSSGAYTLRLDSGDAQR